MVNTSLLTLLESGALRAIDYSFGTFMATRARAHQNDVGVICAYVSRALGQQHSCVYIGELIGMLSDASVSVRSEDIVHRLTEAGVLEAVRVDKAVGTVPLILDGDRIYLHRYWRYETQLAEHIARLSEQRVQLDGELAAGYLTELFGPVDEGEINWQCVAVSVACQCRFAMITGGPGTGKTTTVTRLLALIQKLAMTQGSPLKIRMVAPTGKAAARLTESISRSRLTLPDDVQPHLPSECSTIHRLLGAVPGRPFFKHDGNNPLHLDLLVVDEASMVDLPLMAKLFSALPLNARVILLGDQDQLASVETGSVLTDLCKAATITDSKQGFSEQMVASIQRLTRYRVPILEQRSVVSDNWVVLQKSHRFTAESGIGQLATLFNFGNVPASLALLKKNSEDLFWEQRKSYKRLTDSLRHGASEYFDAVRANDVARAFGALQHQQVLCAQRSGDWGVDKLNQILELEWRSQGWIDTDKEYYVGRPVMLTENDHQQRLYNGDIGIVLPSDPHSDINKVFFQTADGGFRAALPSRLPPHETLYAMTIHKSQGSEFNDVYLCLPDMGASGQLKGLNRALLYTGLTRTRQRFILYASEQVVTLALKQVCRRTSGLAERLGRADR